MYPSKINGDTPSESPPHDPHEGPRDEFATEEDKEGPLPEETLAWILSNPECPGQGDERIFWFDTMKTSMDMIETLPEEARRIVAEHSWEYIYDARELVTGGVREKILQYAQDIFPDILKKMMRKDPSGSAKFLKEDVMRFAELSSEEVREFVEDLLEEGSPGEAELFSKHYNILNSPISGIWQESSDIGHESWARDLVGVAAIEDEHEKLNQLRVAYQTHILDPMVHFLRERLPDLPDAEWEERKSRFSLVLPDADDEKKKAHRGLRAFYRSNYTDSIPREIVVGTKEAQSAHTLIHETVHALSHGGSRGVIFEDRELSSRSAEGLTEAVTEAMARRMDPTRNGSYGDEVRKLRALRKWSGDFHYRFQGKSNAEALPRIIPLETLTEALYREDKKIKPVLKKMGFDDNDITSFFEEAESLFGSFDALSA